MRLCSRTVIGVFILVAALAAFGPSSAVAEQKSIICASTTSTQNTGLFEYLLPLFQKEKGIEVKVVAVGTGHALDMGKRGTPMCCSSTPQTRKRYLWTRGTD